VQASDDATEQQHGGHDPPPGRRDIYRNVSSISERVGRRHADMVFGASPEEVGMGRKPQLWLRDGDVVRSRSRAGGGGDMHQ